MPTSGSRKIRTAALTVGGLRAQNVTLKLLDMAENDVSPLVRPAAVEALGELGDTDVVSRLISMTNDSNAYLRAALAYALGKLAGETPEVQEVLHVLTKDSVEHVALAAQRALEQCDITGESLGEQACPEPTKKHRSWLRRLWWAVFWVEWLVVVYCYGLTPRGLWFLPKTHPPPRLPLLLLLFRRQQQPLRLPRNRNPPPP